MAVELTDAELLTLSQNAASIQAALVDLQGVLNGQSLWHTLASVQTRLQENLQAAAAAAAEAEGILFPAEPEPEPEPEPDPTDPGEGDGEGGGEEPTDP